jgi:hypothetical protein
VHKPEQRRLDARSFLAYWQKRYKITLDDVSEHILQAMEEYAGQSREQADHPDIERILSRVASHEITPAKAMELLQNWCDRAKGIAAPDLQLEPTNGRGPISTYPASDWE